MDLGLHKILTLFEKVEDWNVPVGATNYIEFGRDGVWVDAPTAVMGKDEYDRPFAITTPVFWAREGTRGVTPLMVWSRYTPSEENNHNPVMLTKPGGKSCHQTLSEEEVEALYEFLKGDMRFVSLGDLLLQRADRPIGYSRMMGGQSVRMEGSDEFMADSDRDEVLADLRA